MTLLFMAIIETLHYLTPTLLTAGLGEIMLLGHQVAFFALLVIAIYDAQRQAFIWQLAYALGLVWYLARTDAYVQGITPLAELGAGFPYLLLSAEVLLIVPLTLLTLPFFTILSSRWRQSQ